MKVVLSWSRGGFCDETTTHSCSIVLSNITDRLDDRRLFNFLPAACLVIDIHFAEVAHDLTPRGIIVSVAPTAALKWTPSDLLLS